MPRRSRPRRRVRIEEPPADATERNEVTGRNEVTKALSTCCVHLSRRNISDPWGFSMVGGIDQEKPLCVTKVVPGGPATGMLEEGEIITKIDGTPANNILHKHAVGLITNTGLYLKLTVLRERMVSPPVVTATLPLPVRPSHPTASSILDQAPLPARRAASPIYEWEPLPAENPTFRPANTIPLPIAYGGASSVGRVVVGGASGIKGYAPVPFTLGVRSRMMSTHSRSQSEHRPVRPLQMLTSPPLSSYYTTPFYTTPDVAIAGLPAAATRTVDENLPYGLTLRRTAAPAVHPFRATMVSNYPFRTAPRINRPKKDDSGPCIMMHV